MVQSIITLFSFAVVLAVALVLVISGLRPALALILLIGVQGQLQLWVDVMTPGQAAKFKPVDISPPEPLDVEVQHIHIIHNFLPSRVFKYALRFKAWLLRTCHPGLLAFLAARAKRCVPCLWLRLSFSRTRFF